MAGPFKSFTSHVLGYPRLGSRRELKHALEAYWSGKSDVNSLRSVATDLKHRHWQEQKDAGVTYVVVGDFAYYDHVLNVSSMIGLVPPRFCIEADGVGVPSRLDTTFRMARGRAPTGEPAAACEMTKFYDTNYHYIVPEFYMNRSPKVSEESLSDLVGDIREAKRSGFESVKATLIGPFSFLLMGKVKQGKALTEVFVSQVAHCYGEIMARLESEGIEWCQLDEPMLVMDLQTQDLETLKTVYNELRTKATKIKILLTPYFGSLATTLPQNKVPELMKLPVQGLHLDLVRGSEDLKIAESLPDDWVLSAGVIDGRNIWKADVPKWAERLNSLGQRLGSRLWIGTSCSLLFSPADLTLEEKLGSEYKALLSFAKQKVSEVVAVAKCLQCGTENVDITVPGLICRKNEKVQERLMAVNARYGNAWPEREEVDSSKRLEIQQETLKLPMYPTTTIGSFPQTSDIRKARMAYKKGNMDKAEYEKYMREEIVSCLRKQEEVGLDVLVHGEPERNDMVEYFSDMLHGVISTEHGWVQSYGSRGVKPPIIYGDVSRKGPMTVEWITYAQSMTKQPVKGMLTGPVTILQWSFVRDDQPRSETCKQIALALQDEVNDLANAGIRVIQVDEPAFREGLPLANDAEKEKYLQWAVKCFRLSTCTAPSTVQIHSHMCYSEFNDIFEYIAKMDADVISIEASRSDMELLDAFKSFAYPNHIGPGVYDIHSPNVPTVDTFVRSMTLAKKYVGPEKLWINPDCGLKTRKWEETIPSLKNMVAAARKLREAN